VNFLEGWHGAVALALLAGLLFAEEAGVPLPFAPGELTLLVAGLLISAGGLDPWGFLPVAVLACTGGSLVGYYWARAVGAYSLRSGTDIRATRTLRRRRSAAVRTRSRWLWRAWCQKWRGSTTGMRTTTRWAAEGLREPM